MPVANFIKGRDKAHAGDAWQYNYGQKLYIHGLELPEVVEIGFSLTETGGMDNPRFGITTDGVTEVVIPDSMMEGGDTEEDYHIYAFIFVEDEKQESGQTIKCVQICVKSRPKRWMDDKTGDDFSEIIKAVRELVEEYKKSGVSDEQVQAAVTSYLDKNLIDTLTEEEVRVIVNAALGNIKQTHFEKVDTLPSEWKENTIYLVPAENAEEQNIYDEYIFINGLPELIGTTKIDLAGYAKESYVQEYAQPKGDYASGKEVRQLSATVNDHIDDTNIHVTSAEKQAWNNKSDFSGSYKDLTDKPQIPEGADLTGYAKESFVKEYAQPKGEYLTPSNLSNAVNTALAQAKASGEFKGDKGDKGDNGYTPIKGTDYFTEADKQEIVDDVLEHVEIPSGGGSSEWRYIGLHKVEESCNPFIITTDTDGNPIGEFTEILIFAKLGWMWLSSNSSCNRSLELYSDELTEERYISADFDYETSDLSKLKSTFDLGTFNDNTFPLTKTESEESIDFTKNLSSIWRYGTIHVKKTGILNTMEIISDTGNHIGNYTTSLLGIRGFKTNNKPFTKIKIALGWATNLILKGSSFDVYVR